MRGEVHQYGGEGYQRGVFSALETRSRHPPTIPRIPLPEQPGSVGHRAVPPSEAHSNAVSRGPREALPVSQTVAYNREAVTKKAYTGTQGQYLAFIFYYTKIHGRAPAESEMQNYFNVSPPSVRQMVLTLESNGFIERIPGQGRSIRLMIPRDEPPDLE